MNDRLLASVLVIFSIILFPYWIYVPALIIVMVIFPFYWESILLAFLIDVLYGEGINSLSSLIFSSALLAVLGLLMLIPLRERLRSHV